MFVCVTLKDLKMKKETNMSDVIKCKWPDCDEIKPKYFAQLKGWLKNRWVFETSERSVHINWFCADHKKAAIKLRCEKCGFLSLDYPLNPNNKAMCPKHERSWCAHCLFGNDKLMCPVYGCGQKLSSETFMDTFHKIRNSLLRDNIGHWETVQSAANEKAPSFKTIRNGKTIWMAENLCIDTKDSWFYDYKDSNKEYGQLYSPFAAKKACPDGYSLPSKSHWEEMIGHFGGKEAAGKNLKIVGNSGLNIVLAGRRDNYDGSFAGLDEFGAYWCSDDLDEDSGWAVSFRQDEDKVNFFRTSATCFSVRYIKSA